MVSTPIIHVTAWIATHLATPKGWKAELALLVDPQRTPYPRSGHMLTTDQAQIRESLPAKALPLSHAENECQPCAVWLGGHGWRGRSRQPGIAGLTRKATLNSMRAALYASWTGLQCGARRTICFLIAECLPTTEHQCSGCRNGEDASDHQWCRCTASCPSSSTDNKRLSSCLRGIIRWCHEDNW